MNKITKFLLIIFFIVLGTYLLIKGYVKEEENIANKIGSKVGGGELEATEYYTLVQCMDTYISYIDKKDYKTAYMMLGVPYRKYVPYEEYEKKVSTIDASKMNVENINIVTNTTFDAQLDLSGEKEHYSIIIDNDKNTFSIFPYSFLDYKSVDKKESKKNLECVLNYYVVNTDKCIFSFKLKNKSKRDTINIINATLYTNIDGTVENNDEITILPGEEKDISISFETDYTFPKKIILNREVKGKNTFVEYTFDMDN